jgi:hypothetical protein
LEERDYSPNSNKANHPYGDVGKQAGDYARSLLEELCEPLIYPAYDKDGQPTDWDYADGGALNSYIDFEFFVLHTRATAEVSADEMAAFDLKLNALRLALPLTEAERQWIFQPKGSVDPHYKFIVEEIGVHEVELVSAGVRQVVNGRDVMRRWRAWRREADEYADQGTLDLAREALRGIVELLAPDWPLPASYRKLRGLEDPSQEAQ